MDEKCAYSLLLLHSAWGTTEDHSGEQHLLDMEDSDTVSAVQKLACVLNEEDRFPLYAKLMIDSLNHSQTMLDEVNITSTDIDDLDIDDESSCTTYTFSNHDDEILAEEMKINEKERVDTTPINDVTHISDKDKKIQYKSFISTIQNAFISHHELNNTIQFSTEISSAMDNHDNHHTKVPFDNENELRKQFDDFYKTCSTKQKISVDRIEKALHEVDSCNPKSQLLMYNSGPGGTGKSYIIKLGKLLAKIIIGKTKGLYGASVALAATGSAANQIQGFTVQSALGMGRTGIRNIKDISAALAAAIAKRFQGVRIIFIDEISLISLEMLFKIHKYLCIARLCMAAITEEMSARNKILSKMPFGGFHIVFQETSISYRL
jgi:hypothetical protein